MRIPLTAPPRIVTLGGSDAAAVRFAHAVLMFERDEANAGSSPIALLASVLEREPWLVPYREACAIVGAALRESSTEREL